MIGMMTPLEETPAFKSIFAKGKVEGVAEGKIEELVCQIQQIESGYREGLFPEQTYQILVQPLQARLEDLRRSLC